MRDYFVNEGNRIGGMEPQALGTTQAKITASVAVTKGDLIEMTGNFTVGPAADGSLVVCGIAANDAAIGEPVVIETEGFVKLVALTAVSAGDKVISAGGGKVKALPSVNVADIVLDIADIASAIDLGAAYAQADTNLALNNGLDTMINAVITEINTEVVASVGAAITAVENLANGLIGVCGIVVSGTANANEVAYVKLTL